MDSNNGLTMKDLTPTAQRLYTKYDAMLLTAEQTAEAIGLSAKTLRNYGTTAQIRKGRTPHYLIPLRGTKVGRRRFWHINTVAEWIDQQELIAMDAVANETPRRRGRPRKIEQRIQLERSKKPNL